MTIKEHNNYRSKEPIKGQNVPEFGVKMEDHTLDAIRYGLLYIFKLGATSSLAEVYGPQQWRPEHEMAKSEAIAGTLDSSFDSAIDSSGFGNMEGMQF
jgi:hypothetical protein